jgi:SAM-dependent methyltransferase
MNTTKHFDEHAKTWDDDPAKAARANAVANGIRDRVPLTPAMRGLEYGCGTGLLGFALYPDLGHLTLADSSPGMLAVLDEKIASTALSNLRSLKLDLVTDPAPDEQFDLVCTLMTLHHIDDTDRILRDLHALLRAPGYLCIADLDAEDGSFHGPDFTGHKGFHRPELRDRALRAGFQTVEFSTVFHIAKATEAGETTFPVFLMVATK